MDVGNTKGLLAVKVILNAICLISVLSGLNVIFGGAMAIPGVSAVEASIDNELRFFAVYWLAYGVFSFWVTRNLSERYNFLPSIAVVFFLSGVARLLSIIFVGDPIFMFIPVMFIELLLPFVIYYLYIKLKNQLFVDKGEMT